MDRKEFASRIPEFCEMYGRGASRAAFMELFKGPDGQPEFALVDRAVGIAWLHFHLPELCITEDVVKCMTTPPHRMQRIRGQVHDICKQFGVEDADRLLVKYPQEYAKLIEIARLQLDM